MAFLLLTKHQTHSGLVQNWEIFGNLDAAAIRLDVLKRQSKQYENLPIPFLGPVLVQSTILEVSEVTECKEIT